jgi:ATP-binding cassette subfamily B (MDR/TAP) protein 1
VVLLSVRRISSVCAQLACWNLSGERQTDRIRRSYLRAVLRQEIGWFDKEGANEVGAVLRLR